MALCIRHCKFRAPGGANNHRKRKEKQCGESMGIMRGGKSRYADLA